MKTLAEINQLLEMFEKKFGMKCLDAPQGSGRWLELKLGVISASNAYRAVAKKSSQTRQSYLCELVGEVCSGVVEEISSKYLDYGAEHEGAARANYELKNRSEITQVTFIFKDETFRCGCSPDGVIESKSHGLELKVPFNAAKYADFFLTEGLSSEYMWQVQFSMWCADSESWDFAEYSPTFKANPLKNVSIPRDNEKMKSLDDLIPQFISDYDEALKKIGIPFGGQWKRLAGS